MFGNRRKEIALAVVDEIGKHLGSPLVGDPDFIRGIFAGECFRTGFLPSERDARKIFLRIEREISNRARAATPRGRLSSAANRIQVR
jgi:hypothetical protein